MDLESLKKVPATLLLVRGRLEEAVRFAKELLSSDSESFPDLHLLQPEGKSGNHLFESIHQLVEELSLPPYASPCKVFIIDQAERMLAPSANALLKSLEEPPEDTHLILLTDYPDLLLPTICSRCWRIDFPQLKEEPFADPALPELFGILSKGFNLSALSKVLIKIEESLDQEEGFLKQKKTDQFLHTILYWYRDRHLLALQGDPDLLFHQAHRSILENCRTDLPPLEKVINLLVQARTALQHNVRLRSCLESFFLKLTTP